MKRLHIWLEPDQHRMLTEIAHKENRSLSDLIREMLRLQLEERCHQDLARAAEALLVDYQTDPNLTIFTERDHEDFQ